MINLASLFFTFQNIPNSNTKLEEILSCLSSTTLFSALKQMMILLWKLTVRIWLFVL